MGFTGKELFPTGNTHKFEKSVIARTARCFQKFRIPLEASKLNVIKSSDVELLKSKFYKTITVQRAIVTQGPLRAQSSLRLSENRICQRWKIWTHTTVVDLIEKFDFGA